MLKYLNCKIMANFFYIFWSDYWGPALFIWIFRCVGLSPAARAENQLQPVGLLGGRQNTHIIYAEQKIALKPENLSSVM